MIECTVSVISPMYNSFLGYQCKLIVETATSHIAFLVEHEKKIVGFELYSINNKDTNWESVITAAKNYSKLFSKNFGATQVFYNFKEALIVPAVSFSNNSMDAFIETIFGEQKNCKLVAEKVNIQNQPSIILSVNNNIDLALHKHFGNHYISHVFTNILQKTLSTETMVLEMLKVQFYQSQMIVLVIKNNALSLLQIYDYQTPEDVVYYLLNIVEQFGLSLNNTPVEISGLLNTNTKTFELLENLFTKLSLETVHIDDNSGFEKLINLSNAHFYSPFFNLAQ